MPHDLPPVPPEQLYLRRLAWRALRLVLEQYNLAAVAVEVNPDDPRSALPGLLANQVIFGEDLLRRYGSTYATVTIDGTRARVIVPDVRRLVRQKHQRDFRPEEVGIFPARRRPGQDEADRQPDVVADVELADVIERDGELMRAAPQRMTSPASGPARPVEVIRAFGSTRG